MNDEHPTQPTEVLPEQDGTRNRDDPGAANGMVGAMGDLNASESAESRALSPESLAPGPEPAESEAGPATGDPRLVSSGEDMGASPVSERDEPSDTGAPDTGAPDMSGAEGQATIPELRQGDQDRDQDMSGTSGMAPTESSPPPAGTGASDAGEPAIEPAVAEAYTPFHPDLPTGGTPEEAPAALPTGGTPEEAPAAYQMQQEEAPAAPAAPAEEPGEGEPGEAPVVRTTRDPRLDEMAPNASMEDLLKASEQQYRALKHGDVIEGTVMKVGRDELLVDIGSKSEGIIPSHELQSLTEEEREAMQVGDGLLVSVVQPENNEGHAILSLDRARQEKSWRDLQKQYEEGEVIQAEVSGYNKGGLLVNLGGVRGFVPSSQVSSISAGEANKQAEMARLQGKTLPLKIIEINRGRNRLILSQRQAVQEERESMRSRLLKELQQGQTRQGRVSSICDFGAFVDIGGADGLIHLSELSWKRVSHPSEVLKVGDVINVYVLSVDPNERKIALSLKRTQPEPWATITENYQLGQIVRGTITQLTSFGAFARLEDGIEGLIHVSELAEGRVAHPRNVVNVGDVVDLKVIRIDPGRKRIGLSLKRVHEDAERGEPGAGPQDGAPGAVDEETATHATEPAPASGQPARQQERERERPRGGGGGRPEAQAPRPQPQSQAQPQPQARREPSADVTLPSDEEPMGAMAHAFATRAQSLQAAVEAEAEPEAEAEAPAAEEDEATTGPSVAPTEAEIEMAPEASMPSATDMEAAEDATGMEASAGEASASVEDTGMAGETGTGEPEDMSGTGLSTGGPGESEVMAEDSGAAGSEVTEADDTETEPEGMASQAQNAGDSPADAEMPGDEMGEPEAKP